MVTVDLSAELDMMCGRIERSFPGVLCAYQGFAHPRIPIEDVAVVIEVFLAPRGSSRPITRLTHEDCRRIWRGRQVSVVVVAHYIDDTLRYYMDDVLAILAVRGSTYFLDPGGFCEEMIPRGTARGGVPSWGGPETPGSVTNVWGVIAGVSRRAWGKRIHRSGSATAGSSVSTPEIGYVR